MKKKKRLYLLGDVLGVAAAFIIFIVPFAFMLVNALKERREANLLSIALPTEFHWENFAEVFKANNYQILTAFKNSGLIVVGSVLILIIVGSMGGYVLQRRKDRVMGIMNSLIMAGLMVPAAILPTIWVLQRIHLYKTIWGMILIEVALQIPFTIMLFRGFMSSIPIELEEAGYMDGCSKWKIFSAIIFPLLKPVTSTVIILNAVTIFNDFTNPLYFLPGAENATVQLTLYNFMGQYSSSYNMLFADVILITIPMLILFIFFNKRIVEGMVAGAVKG
ncbi:carbohydrate ABC transporter permease [Faecalicatena orotica]|uniref:Raffinose/stachyose/melibiose transport system permease protein n=1 Tax=Faecalicatena orotica TaxID=1544 RepID=A0A2Y9BJP6_9FIRM|nr:carbohydrate ABC transporter permease [Faecalicatena orotica]PWJ23426.1 raffinose/stachyose/melibiose transport system permease protein [Faecalicatena orotica]SSA57684.1 raffinose/stachyose/melibiose transport system permease protein [Faecalicatena orotica]